jgi:hypothetical protein
MNGAAERRLREVPVSVRPAGSPTPPPPPPTHTPRARSNMKRIATVIILAGVMFVSGLRRHSTDRRSSTDEPPGRYDHAGSVPKTRPQAAEDHRGRWHRGLGAPRRHQRHRPSKPPWPSGSAMPSTPSTDRTPRHGDRGVRAGRTAEGDPVLSSAGRSFSSANTYCLFCPRGHFSQTKQGL